MSFIAVSQEEVHGESNTTSIRSECARVANDPAGADLASDRLFIHAFMNSLILSGGS
ncbi:MAG: hypothetical protein ACREMQ_17745 [Longimicrobiales bacterium]